MLFKTEMDGLYIERAAEGKKDIRIVLIALTGYNKVPLRKSRLIADMLQILRYLHLIIFMDGITP